MSRSIDDGAAVLANHGFVDTDDPEAARDQVSAVLVPHDLEVHRGLLPFRAVYRLAALDTVSLHYLRYEPEVSMTWAPLREFHMLVFPIAGACRIGSGRKRIEIEPGQGFVFDPKTSARLDLIGNCEAVFVKIRASVLESRLQGPIEFDSRRALAPEASAALIDLVLWICRDLDHRAPLSVEASTAQSIEALLLDAVVGSCPHNNSEALARPARRPVSQSIRRCEAFIELHADEPITIADMTRISGASERMLFKEFRDHRSTNPMAFLKSVRLERAHTDLKRAETGHDTVAGIAGAWRFAHPGQFAKDYRLRFGRNPSDTLRRGSNSGYPGAPDADDGGMEHGA